MTTSELVFDPFSEEFFNGPWEIYRRMREEAPVYYNPEYDFYALSRHEDVAADPAAAPLPLPRLTPDRPEDRVGRLCPALRSAHVVAAARKARPQL